MIDTLSTVQTVTMVAVAAAGLGGLAVGFRLGQAAGLAALDALTRTLTDNFAASLNRERAVYRAEFQQQAVALRTAAAASAQQVYQAGIAEGVARASEGHEAAAELLPTRH